MNATFSTPPLHRRHWLLLLAGATSAVLAQADAHNPPPMRRWSMVARRDVEPQHPGQGISFAFSSFSTSVNAYYYDLRRTWQRGLDDPLFNQAFKLMGDEIRHFNADAVFDEPHELSAGGLLFRCQGVHYERQGTAVVSRSCLTAVNGKLLNYRFSAPKAMAAHFDADVQSVLGETLDARIGLPLPWLPLSAD